MARYFMFTSPTTITSLLFFLFIFTIIDQINALTTTQSPHILTSSQIAQRAALRHTYIDKASIVYSKRRDSALHYESYSKPLTNHDSTSPQYTPPSTTSPDVELYHSYFASFSTALQQYHIDKDYQNRFAHFTEIAFIQAHQPKAISNNAMALKKIAKLFFHSHETGDNGVLKFTDKTLDAFLSLTPRPFTTLFLISATGKYPPACENCRTFESSYLQWAKDILPEQVQYFNQTLSDLATDSLIFPIPTTPRQLSDTKHALDLYPTLIQGQIDLATAKKFFQVNSIMQAPFMVLLPPTFLPTITDNTFIQDLPLEHKFYASNQEYDMSTFKSQLQSAFGVALKSRFDFEVKLDIQELFNYVSTFQIFAFVYVLIFIAAIYLSSLQYWSSFRIFRYVGAFFTILFLCYQYGAPAINKSTKAQFGYDWFSFYNAGSYLSWFFHSVLGLSTWAHTDSRSSHVGEVISVAIFYFIIAATVIFLLTISRGFLTPSLPHFEITNDATKSFFLKIYRFRQFSAQQHVQQQERHQDGVLQTHKLPTHPVRSSLLQQPQLNATQRFPLRLFSYFFTNITIIILLAIINLFVIAYLQVYFMKNQWLLQHMDDANEQLDYFITFVTKPTFGVDFKTIYKSFASIIHPYKP